MENFINNFISKNEKQFKKYKEYLLENNWTTTKPVISKKEKTALEKDTEKQTARFSDLANELNDRKAESTVQFNLMSVLADKLEYFSKEASADSHTETYKNFVRKGVEILKIFIERAEEYNDDVDIRDIPYQALRQDEIAFHNQLFKQTAQLQKKLSIINFNEDSGEYDNAKIEFHNKKKATFVTRELLCLLREDVKEITSKIPVNWSLRTSKEMFINMNPKDIPKWNYNKHYFEQDPVVLQFWSEEYNKISNGVTIGGYFMHPWLYFHLNFFRTPIPQKDGTEPNIQPDLRDNEWFFAENLKRCINPDNDAYYSKAILMYGTRRFGKALRNDQHLHYTDGSIRPIGLAKIGDEIFGSDGLPTKIQGVYPQGIVDLYEVEFADGRKSICCDEHLWTIYDNQAKKYKTLPLKEIIKDGWSYKRRRNNGSKETDVLKYSIPICKPVQYESGFIPNIDPYYLGLWLGDGSKKTSSVTTMDEEIRDYIYEYSSKLGLKVRKESKDNGKACTYFTVGGKGVDNILFNNLRDYRLTTQKHIPEVYLTASEEIRMELLRGLMDTDGTINKGGSDISYVSSDEILAKDVLELVRGLGIHARIEKNTGNYVKKDGELNTYYKIIMYTDKKVFKLNRKLERMDTYNIRRSSKIERTHIVGIRKIQSDYATCIRVDNKSKEFLTNDYIVTHNSVILASLAHWRTLTKFNSFGSIIGGSTSDINALTSKVKTSMTYIDEPFKLDIMKQEWENGETTFGIREDAQSPRVFSTLVVQNLESGAKSKSQKTAGLAPSVSIYDEIGKYNFLKAYLAALPSFKTPYGFKCVTVLAGTGGEADLSKDAVDVLNSPESYDLLPMDWDLLENNIDPEHISWRRRKFATFFPGQMAYETGFLKQKRKFSDFLNIKDKELDKIGIHVTNWENNTKILLNVIEDAKKLGGAKGKILEQQKRVQYPIDPEDCFIATDTNPYPVEELKKRKQELIESGDLGKKVILTQDSTGKVSYELSNKDIAKYPHNGGFIDAPVVLYQELPEINPPQYLYVAGFDDYKQEESDTDSIGSFYIYRVNVGEDIWKGRIVASLATRPDPHLKLYRQIYLLQQAFNAICFMENADDGYKQYLERKRVADIWLQTSLDFKAESTQASTNKRKYGWTPTKENIRYLKNLTIQYTKEEFTYTNEDGVEITITGAQKINDIELLQEMIDYRDDNNVDRITAFGSCLGLEFHYYTNWMLPKIDKKEKREEEKPKKQERTMIDRMYGSGTRKKRFF